MFRYFKYCQFITSLFVVAHPLFATLTNEAEILPVLEEYIVLSDPHTLSNASPSELSDINKFADKYNALSDELGKREVFYFIELSNRIQKPEFKHLRIVAEVPKHFLQFYDDYDLNERRIIGDYIWEHYQLGNLSVNSLSKVNLPHVVRHLKDELAVEGGTNTGRGYKIWKLLDEMGALSAPLTTPTPDIAKVVEEATPSKKADENLAEVAPFDVVEETPEQSSQWWLWLIWLLVFVGVILVLRSRK